MYGKLIFPLYKKNLFLPLATLCVISPSYCLVTIPVISEPYLRSEAINKDRVTSGVCV